MPDAQPHATEIFLHIRVVMGIVLGMGMTRLLTGVARFLQHPGRQRVYPVHMGWVFSMLLALIHFWWWEFALYEVTRWTFPIYFFLIAYTILLFLLCALLFPDNIAEYASYEDFFLSRRRWFFGIFALTFVFDVIDTLLKGPAHFAMFGTEYSIRLVVYLMLCAVAIASTNRRFHIAFVGGNLIYQVIWIVRLYNTI